MGRGAVIVCISAGAFCLGSFFLYLASGTPAPDPPPIPTEPEPSPAAPEKVEQRPAMGDRWDKLLHQSPMRHKMRRMWLDCALITGNGYDPAFAELDFLEDAARDIQKRAGGTAAYWKDVRDGNRRAAALAKTKQWKLAQQASDEMHDACGACHDETWPLSARAYVRGTLETWAKEQTVWVDEPWGEQVMSAPPPVLKMMSGLRDNMFGINRAIAARDWAALREISRKQNEVADDQYKMWREIERQAGFIVESAEEGDLTDIGTFYNTMTATCRGCHARFAAGRAFDPLPWPDHLD